MASAVEERFKKMAVSGGYLTPEDLEKAERVRGEDSKGRNLVTILVKLKVLTREQVEEVKRKITEESPPGKPPKDASAPAPAPKKEAEDESAEETAGSPIAPLPLPPDDDPDPSSLETVNVPAGATTESRPEDESGLETLPPPKSDIPFPKREGKKGIADTTDVPPSSPQRHKDPTELTADGRGRTLVGEGKLRAAEEDPLLGRTLGGCKIEEVLGEGGMGVVYRGVDISLNRQCAVKVLPSRVVKKQMLVERFHREARAAAQVEHPNIVQVYRVGVEGDRHFIVMQYVKGESLSDLLRREGKLEYRRAMRMIFDVAKGLAHAHEHGIIHRDIKPDNIFLTEKGEVKLGDFGLARELKMDSDISQTGQILGTPYYMSPEACSAGKVDGRADIYSLGATFYFMLTGVKPFTGNTPYEVILKHMKEPLIDPRDHVSNLPQELVAIVDRMMAKRPEDRFPDADAMVEAMEAIVHKWQLLDSSGRIPIPKTRLNWLVMGGAGGLLILAAVVVTIFLLSKQAREDYEKQAQGAFAAARKKAGSLAEKGRFLSAQRVMKTFLLNYENSSQAHEAKGEIADIDNKANARFALLAEKVEAALEAFDPKSAQEFLAALRDLEMPSSRESMAKERFSTLAAELKETKELKSQINALPGIVDAHPQRMERAKAFLEGSLSSQFKRIRLEAGKGIVIMDLIHRLREALAEADDAADNKEYDRALSILRPYAGAEPEFIGTRGTAEVKKVEALVRHERETFSESLKKAEKAGNGKRFQEALNTLAPFENSGISDVARRAKAERRNWMEKAEAFREEFQRTLKRARGLIQGKDFKAAETSLQPFTASDLEDVSAQAWALLKEVSLRHRTPEGFVFVTGGTVKIGDGEEAVGSFYMMRYEVSNREFREYLKENPGAASPWGWKDGSLPAGKENLPVTGITRQEAMAFAAWLGEKMNRVCRLPTEAEWQWAASSEKGPYPWGEDGGSF